MASIHSANDFGPMTWEAGDLIEMNLPDDDTTIAANKREHEGSLIEAEIKRPDPYNISLGINVYDSYSLGWMTTRNLQSEILEKVTYIDMHCEPSLQDVFNATKGRITIDRHHIELPVQEITRIVEESKTIDYSKVLKKLPRSLETAKRIKAKRAVHEDMSNK